VLLHALRNVVGNAVALLLHRGVTAIPAPPCALALAQRQLQSAACPHGGVLRIYPVTRAAWRICPELRRLMSSADLRGKLGGPGKHLELDKTLVRGKTPLSHRVNKTTVFGIAERHGRILAGPVADESKYTLEPIIREKSNWVLLLALMVTMLIVILAATMHTVRSTTAQKNTCGTIITPTQSGIISRC
jgi:hypothetical protein